MWLEALTMKPDYVCPNLGYASYSLITLRLPSLTYKTSACVPGF